MKKTFFLIHKALTLIRFNEESASNFKNFLSLGSGQIVVVVIPIILYPLILRRFGGENLALYIYLTAISALASQLIDFGFDSLNLKRFSDNNSSEATVKNLQVSLCVKFCIWLFFSVFIAIFAAFTHLNAAPMIVALMSLEAVFNNPWYLQILDRTRLTPIHLVVSRIFILLFSFTTEHFETFLFLSASTSLVSVAINLSITYKTTKQNFDKHLFNGLLNDLNIVGELRQGSVFFVSRFSSIAGAKSVQLVGYKFVDPTLIVVLDFLEKMLGIASLLFGTANQAVLASVYRNKSIDVAFLMIVKFLFASLLLMFVIYFLGDSISVWYFGDENHTFHNLLPYYVLNIPCIAFNYFSGITFLVPFGYSNYFNFSTIIGFIFILSAIVFMTITQVFLSPLALVLIILAGNISVALVRLVGVCQILWRKNNA